MPRKDPQEVIELFDLISKLLPRAVAFDGTIVRSSGTKYANEDDFLSDDVADVLFSNVDKHTREGETPVRLCNYVDVLATKDSEDADDIAISALVAEDWPGVICGYHLALIRPRLKRITGDFLAWLHRSKQFHAQYEANAVGVTRFDLSQYSFRSARIPLPPIAEQLRINRYLEFSCASIDAVAAFGTPKDDAKLSNGLLNQQTKTLRAYRKSLIHECVTGQCPISEADLVQAKSHA
jgi:hypothetical protein